MVVSQLAECTDLESFARSGVFTKAVLWIAPDLTVFLIASADSTHFWIHSLDNVG